MPKVLIVNKGLHDYTSAKEFGSLVSLTEGTHSRVNVTQMVRSMGATIEASSPEDWLLISGTTVINCVACTLFALRHGRLNLLIHTARENMYVPRTLSFKRGPTWNP